jgi:hypothetical protein
MLCHSKLRELVLVTLAVLGATGSTEGRADVIDFEFNQDGVLPSAQGAIYSGNVPETSAYSVSGGLLHQYTLSPQVNATAEYRVPGVFNHQFGATSEWSAKVFHDSAVGVQILVSHGALAWNFVLADTGVLAVSEGSSGFVLSVSMSTTDAFHLYKAVIPARGMSSTSASMETLGSLDCCPEQPKTNCSGGFHPGGRKRQSGLGLHSSRQSDSKTRTVIPRDRTHGAGLPAGLPGNTVLEVATAIERRSAPPSPTPPQR